MRVGVLVVLGLFLVPVSGCGLKGASTPGLTVPVKGKVTLNGKLVTQGTVMFESLENGKEAHGAIQADGTYEISTFKNGDGALVGGHRVAVSADKKQGVPPKYRNVASSKLEIEVSADKTDYPIELK